MNAHAATQPIRSIAIASLLTLGGFDSAHSAPATPYIDPLSGNLATSPSRSDVNIPFHHYSKEYGAEKDTNALGSALPGQLLAWDGQGGVKDGLKYPAINTDKQVDAIANHRDYLFNDVVRNNSVLLFSYRLYDGGLRRFTDVGDPIHYETSQGTVTSWASVTEVDRDHPPVNLDSLEVFGGREGQEVYDADRYSLSDDSSTGLSIYNFDGSPFLQHQQLVTAMLGSLDSGYFRNYENAIDLDALMVFEDTETPQQYGWIDAHQTFDPGTEGVPNLFDPAKDAILFSLAPIAASNYIGDAVYLWNADGISLLNHGGHLWTNNWTGGIDVDALEAGGTPLPIPSAIWFMISALSGFAFLGRREKTNPPS